MKSYVDAQKELMDAVVKPVREHKHPGKVVHHKKAAHHKKHLAAAAA